MSVSTIKGFNGQYRFLSNFYPCTVTYNGLVYRSVEAAFQAQKDPENAAIFTTLEAAAAKRAGRKCPIRPDWDDVKLSIMNELVLIKFTENPSLRQKLLNTGNCALIEDNYWGDTYWGVSNGVGENHLGRILMNVRNQLYRSVEHDIYHGKGDGL